MIVGVGLDVVDIDEWEQEVNARGLTWIERVSNAREQEYCKRQADPYRTFAGLLAAKEATLKAFGTGWSDDADWQDIEILHDNGKPAVSIKGALLAARKEMSLTRIAISVTHTKHYAAAVVIVEM
jgi:holo-[acyl-carrier protein] synthase